MSKFGALTDRLVETSRMPLLDVATGEPIKDKNGNEAYIEFMSNDSETARKFDKQLYNRALRVQRNGFRPSQAPADEDPAEEQIERLLALVTGWYLVDPESREPIEIKGADEQPLPNGGFTKENARDLFQQWPGARKQAIIWITTEANFIRRSSKS